MLFCASNEKGVAANWRCAAQVLGHAHCCQISPAINNALTKTHTSYKHTHRFFVQNNMLLPQIKKGFDLHYSGSCTLHILSSIVCYLCGPESQCAG